MKQQKPDSKKQSRKAKPKHKSHHLPHYTLTRSRSLFGCICTLQTDHTKELQISNIKYYQIFTGVINSNWISNVAVIFQVTFICKSRIILCFKPLSKRLINHFNRNCLYLYLSFVTVQYIFSKREKLSHHLFIICS